MRRSQLNSACRQTAASEELLHRLERHFIALAQQDQQPVVLIDEAQALPADTLEAVRLLTNLETEKRKLLQVVLFGQPELMARLHEKGTRQILTRISFHATLRPLDRAEVATYVQHRLKVAGREEALFTPWAMRALWHASRGLPRLVNIIAAKAMMHAYGRGAHRVTYRHVRAAARDTLAVRQGWRASSLVWGAGVAGTGRCRSRCQLAYVGLSPEGNGMSIINQMLRDLDARGAASNEQPATAHDALPKRNGPSTRMVATLLVLALAGGLAGYIAAIRHA